MTFTRSLLPLLLATLSLLGGVLPARAETAPLRTCLMHTEPWTFYTREAGNERKSVLAGIFVDISREVSRESGLSLEYTAMPYGRVAKELQSGDCDLTFLIRSDVRDSYVDYAALLFTFNSLIIARPQLQLRQYEDLKGLRIGLLKDIRLNPRFDGDGDLYKVEARDYETLVDMFLNGRLDAIAGNSISLPYLLQKRGVTPASLPKLVLQKTEVWAQMSKRSPQIGQLSKLRNAVEKLRNDGYFDTLLQRYRSPVEEAPQAKRLMREATAVALAPLPVSPR